MTDGAIQDDRHAATASRIAKKHRLRSLFSISMGQESIRRRSVARRSFTSGRRRAAQHAYAISVRHRQAPVPIRPRERPVIPRPMACSEQRGAGRPSRNTGPGKNGGRARHRRAILIAARRTSKAAPVTRCGWPPAPSHVLTTTPFVPWASAPRGRACHTALERRFRGPGSKFAVETVSGQA